MNSVKSIIKYTLRILAINSILFSFSTQATVHFEMIEDMPGAVIPIVESDSEVDNDSDIEQTDSDGDEEGSEMLTFATYYTPRYTLGQVPSNEEQQAVFAPVDANILESAMPQLPLEAQFLLLCAIFAIIWGYNTNY